VNIQKASEFDTLRARHACSAAEPRNAPKACASISRRAELHLANVIELISRYVYLPKYSEREPAVKKHARQLIHDKSNIEKEQARVTEES